MPDSLFTVCFGKGRRVVRLRNNKIPVWHGFYVAPFFNKVSKYCLFYDDESISKIKAVRVYPVRLFESN